MPKGQVNMYGYALGTNRSAADALRMFGTQNIQDSDEQIFSGTGPIDSLVRDRESATSIANPPNKEKLDWGQITSVILINCIHYIIMLC
jgi:hypothetical protein